MEPSQPIGNRDGLAPTNERRGLQLRNQLELGVPDPEPIPMGFPWLASQNSSREKGDYPPPPSWDERSNIDVAEKFPIW